MGGPGAPKGQRLKVGAKERQKKQNKIQNTINARVKRDENNKGLSGKPQKTGRITKNPTKAEKLAASRLNKAESLIPEGTTRFDVGKNRKGSFVINRFRKGDTSHTVIDNLKTGKRHEKINFHNADVVEGQRKKTGQPKPKTPRIKMKKSNTAQKGKYDHLPENEQRFWKYLDHVGEVNRELHEKNDVKPGSDKARLKNSSEGKDSLPMQSQIDLDTGTHRWDTAFVKDSRMYFPDENNKSVRWIELKNIPQGATTIANGRLSTIQEAGKKGTNKNETNYWIYTKGNSIEVFPNYPEDKTAVTNFIRKAQKMPLADSFGNSKEPDPEAVQRLQKVNKKLNTWMNQYLKQGDSLSTAKEKVWNRSLNELKDEINKVIEIVGVAMTANAVLGLFGFRGIGRGSGFSLRATRDLSVPKTSATENVSTSPVKPASKPRRLTNLRKYAPYQMEKVHEPATEDSFLPPENAKIPTKAGSFRNHPDFMPNEHPKGRGYNRIKAKIPNGTRSHAELELIEAHSELKKTMAPPPGNQPELWNAHHVIPYENRNHPLIREIFPEGWNIHDGKQNGIHLPIQDGVNGAGKQMLHTTNHPRYRRIVAKKLNEIYRSSKSAAEKKNDVENLVTELRNHLNNGGESGPRHMR